MHDFDKIRLAREAAPRTFKIGGEEFTYHTAVRPEEILAWYEMRSGEKPATQVEQLAVFDSTIGLFLSPGQEEKWRKVRSAETDPPVSLVDMSDLLDWLFEEQAARPTTGPPSSSDGSAAGTTGTPSTAPSSEPVASA